MSNIILLGLVSLFTDISTQMVYPILPLYLSTVMGAGPAIIGIIEGIAESLASIVKLFSGIVADRYGHKKRLAIFGYASSTVNKIIILLSVTWTGVLIARIIDRFGKGIRAAPRDAMIAESADKSRLGKAYGLHKGLDLLGTAIGIILAWLILSSGDDEYKKIFLYSLIPAFAGLVILLFVKDKKQESWGKTPGETQSKKIAFNWQNLDRRLKLFLVFLFLFTLGNSSNAFILLRAYNAGFSARGAILLYFIFNMTASILSYPAGMLSDKFGRKNLLCAGYLLYGIVYLAIGLLSSNIAFIVLFVIYGFYGAMTTGVERALIVDIVPPEHKAGTLGLHAAIVGIGLLPASVIAGFLWTWLGPSAPFLFGGGLAFVTCIGLFVVLGYHGWQTVPE
ncbi:MAG: MFS transporter [Treponema sp.]|jgi:MFS family permease|nr:MFS transporter [Treponema sp.]